MIYFVSADRLWKQCSRRNLWRGGAEEGEGKGEKRGGRGEGGGGGRAQAKRKRVREREQDCQVNDDTGGR